MTYNPDLLDRTKRHREKQKNADNPMGKKPDWIKVRAPQGKVYDETREIVRKHKLTTVCEEAGCPNVGECWNKSHATFMIMGEVQRLEQCVPGAERIGRGRGETTWGIEGDVCDLMCPRARALCSCLLMYNKYPVPVRRAI